MKEKKKLSLRKVLIIEAILLLFIGMATFIVETSVTMDRQKANLIARLDSVTKTFTKSYEETQEMTEIYDASLTSKVESLAYLYDHESDFTIDDELLKLYDIDLITLENPISHKEGYRYYSAFTSDNHIITIAKNEAELNRILDAIYTENKILQRIVSLDDLFLIITTADGNIVYYRDEQYIGKNITELGIKMTDLVEKDAKWLRINRQRYYTSSAVNHILGITVVCGIDSNRMTLNSHIATFIIYVIICIVFTVVVTYTYFARQEGKRQEKSENYSHINLMKKVAVFAALGLVIISLTTYYVQTLFALSMHSIDVNNHIGEVQSSVAEGKNSVEKLTEHYNNSYLNKAQIIASILSKHPELQTKKELKKLSDIFDTQYIMLFDMNGVETISDSGITGFVISDDPEDQSYPFRVLKHGIPYYIQEAMNDELTGEYHQFIGAALYDENGDQSGFLQIAVSPEKLETVLEEASLKMILNNKIAGTGEEAFVINAASGKFTYASTGDFAGQLAVDYGVSEDQIRNQYNGYLTIDGVRYYANSFEVNDELVYITGRTNSIFRGRIALTINSVIMSLINLIFFTIYMVRHDVEDPAVSEEGLYVDVTMASGQQKQTLNILARMLRQKIDWKDRTAETKTAFIIRNIMGVFAVMFIIALIFRNVIYTDDTIMGFIFSNKWEKGFNVFALTEVIIILFIYGFVMSAFNFLMSELLSLVSPKNETVIRLVQSFIRYIGTLFILYHCLSLFGFDSQSLLASAGLLTLVVGLGARDLITDILAGIFIIFEHEFQVGDIIEVNNYKGRVIEIGIRTTRIVNTTQDVKSINNRNLTNIINKTRRNSYCDVIINVPFDQDIRAIEKLLTEELPKIKAKCPYIIAGPSYGGIDDMSTRSMRLSIRTECLENYKFEVRTFVNKEIKDLFDANGFKLV